MKYAHQRLVEMFENYEMEHGACPAVIALGKTHLEDLQNFFEVRPDGLYFMDVEIIQHNDPIGILMAHRNDN
jgi:hypothetical protein